jgi:acetylornithine deacetylase
MKHATVGEVLSELVSIPSVSTMTNRPVIQYVETLLSRTDWEIERYPYFDQAGTEKINLVARTGPESDRNQLALVCHTDTVPFEPGWANAVNPKLSRGKLYGCGACDIKGFLACALTAVSRLDLARLKRSLALVCTADEEIGCVGAKRIAAEKNVHARYAVVGEPTDLHPVVAGKGYALAAVTVKGRTAHSAFPSEGRSAIYDAARVLQRIEALSQKITEERHEKFDPPFTTLNVGVIQGGTAKNIVPGECRMLLEWRPVPGQKPSLVADLVEEELRGLRKEGVDATIKVSRLDSGFETSQESEIARLLESLSRRRAGTVAFGTEAPYFNQLGAETVVFGAGEMRVAHRTGEHVRIKDLERCERILEQVIERMCW